jgi:hypothetical protein
LHHEVLRLAGQSRTAGSLEAVGGELADVVLAGQVVARGLHLVQPSLDLQACSPGSRTPAPWVTSMAIIRSAVNVVSEDGAYLGHELRRAIWLTEDLATALNVDLNAAVLAKLAVVESRFGLSAAVPS